MTLLTRVDFLQRLLICAGWETNTPPVAGNVELETQCELHGRVRVFVDKEDKKTPEACRGME